MILFLFIKQGVDVNKIYAYCVYTPLSEAIVCDARIEITTLLIDQGADLDFMSNQYSHITPLMLGANESRLGATELLIKRGANIHIKHSERKTALDLATDWVNKTKDETKKQDFEKIIQLIEAQQEWENSLKEAAEKREATEVKRLLESGPNIKGTIHNLLDTNNDANKNIEAAKFISQTSVETKNTLYAQYTENRALYAEYSQNRIRCIN